MGLLRALRALLLCALCVSAFSCFALDRHAFTFTDYNLTVTLDPPKSGLSAQGTVTLRNDSAEPQKVAVLQVSSSLDWGTITVAGKAVQVVTQPYVSDIDHTGALSEALVTLPTPVPPQGSVQIEVAYAGAITQDATRLTRIGVPDATARRSDWDRISDPYAALRGVGYVAWYPIATEAQSLSEGSGLFREVGTWQLRESKAAMLISVGVIGGGTVTILSNGNIQPDCAFLDTRARDVDIRNSRCFWFRGMGAGSPALLVGKYERLTRSGGEIDYLPGHQPLAEDYARVISGLLPSVSAWFGAPTQPVRIVELPWADATSWESGPMFLTVLKQSLREPLELQFSHQLAHASLASSRPWIFEGAAQFAQALERERQTGRRAAIEFMQAQSEPLLAAQQPALPDAPGRQEPAPPRPLEPLATTSDEVFYRLKAMWVWWMLRDMVGDAALQRAFQAYRSQDDREPSYMQRLLETESKRKLEWFFDDWIYRDRGLPDFRVESVYPRATLAGGWVLTITVEDRGDAGAEVPVTVETAHGAVTRRLEVHARSKAFLRIEVPEAPLRVVVNDGSVPEVLRKDNVFEVKLPRS